MQAVDAQELKFLLLELYRQSMKLMLWFVLWITNLVVYVLDFEQM